MLTNLVKLLRVAAVVALGLVAPAMAEAQSRSTSTSRGSASTSSQTDIPDRDPKGDPNAGLLWIGGAILALIFLAWLAMRIGDVDHPSDKIPN